MVVVVSGVVCRGKGVVLGLSGVPSDRHLLHADHESWALHAKYTDMAPRVQVLQWLMELGCDHDSNDAKALLGNLLCNGWVQRPVTMDQ